MTDPLKTLAEETRYKFIMHGAETYDVTQRVRKQNEALILSALQKAYEMGRDDALMEDSKPEQFKEGAD